MDNCRVAGVVERSSLDTAYLRQQIGGLSSGLMITFTNQLHEMFNLFRNPCPIGAKILLQRNSAKERDDEVSQGFIVASLSPRSG